MVGSTHLGQLHSCMSLDTGVGRVRGVKSVEAGYNCTK